MNMASIFRRGSDEMFGVDVSASAIKLVGLGGVKERLVLEHCAMDPLSAGCVIDGTIEKVDEAAAALQRLVKRTGAKAKKIALALPSSSVITKKIAIPAGLTPLEMEEQVDVEAKQYIPFPLEDVSLDFFDMGLSPERPGQADVLIAAARREHVQNLQDFAEAAGMVPVIVDVHSYALRLAIGRILDVQAKTTPGTLSVLYKLGAHKTSLQVLRGKDIVYERDQTVGGAQLTQKIASHYGLSAAEAESKKCVGNLGPGYEATVLAPFVATLVQELARGLQLFFNSTPYNKVNQVFLAGGGALLGGLAAAVATETQVPCSIVNPFEGMVVGAAIQRKHVLQDAPAYLGACGLALRRFFN